MNVSARSPRWRGAAPALVLAAFILACAAWILPKHGRNPLAETGVWAFLVLVAFIGWGSLVRLMIAPNERADLGLRAAWGAGLLCLLGGVLMVPALMTRTTALLLVEVGLVLGIATVLRERRGLRSGLRYVARLAKREPGIALVALVVAAGVAVTCLAGIADWHTNPYDDDIAYLAFVKKLADTGTVIEPFSFRRLSAYGGQTFFVELCSLRAAPSQGFTFDRCVCFVMIVALMLGHRVRGKRPSGLFLLTTIAMLVALPSISINTASYFSGVVFFLALFRTLVWLSERNLAPWRAATPIALVAATVCTLRQSYLPVPVFVLGASYFSRFRSERGSIVSRLAEPLCVGGLTLAMLLPWFIVSWQSNRTFLYPLMAGTFHKPLALNASGWNLVREVGFQTSVMLEGMPIHTLGLFVLAIVLLRESDPRRPLGTLCLGSIAGYILLVHGLTQSDPQNIGRYAFSFMAAVAIAAALTLGTARFRAKPGRFEVAAGIVLFAILAQLVESREVLWKEGLALKFRNIETLAYSVPRSQATDPPELGLYDRLQAAVPPGERIAVLVDEPYYFNFARNPIWNIDMPGYSSPAPGMPVFKGSEAVESYLRGLGLRWFIFVLPDHSRYHYRREYFLESFVNEQELWRTYGPYMVDFLDAIVAIGKRHREAYAERGIVVIDLAEPRR